MWLLLLLGRWSMVTGWMDLGRSLFSRGGNREFVSVDANAQYDVKSDSAYEMISKDKSGMVTSPPSVQLSPTPTSGLKTPDHYGQTARYQPPVRSFSSPRPPSSPDGWDASATYARPMYQRRYYEDEEKGDNMNPLGMNRI
ncbi:hypothetical protein IMZ48_28795 [Candidatus Bathyarchaeota archaeon]|nr:hypothetical protein [Candidatus Bathyarchaeota archaeon]